MDRNDRAITAFTMIGHAMFHTYELVIPIFVVIWLDVFVTTPATLGIVVGASYALTGIGALPSGLLADRISAKRLIILCLAGMGISFALVSVAPTLAVLTVALLGWGLAASVYHPAGLALISRGTKRRGAAFAYHGAAGNVGVAFGPLLAAILLVFLDWRIVAAILVLPVAIALLIVSRLSFDERAGSRARATGNPDSDMETESIQSVSEFIDRSRLLFTGGFVLVFFVAILYGMYYRGTLTFLPDILVALPALEPVTIGDRTLEPGQYVYSGLLLLGGLGQFFGGMLVERIRAEYALVLTYTVLVILALVFVPATAAGLAPLLLIAGLIGFAIFMVAPINQEVISKYTSANVRGMSFGYTYIAIFGVGALGATLAGVILTYAAPLVLFLTLAGMAVGAVLLGIVLAHRSSE